MGTEYVTYSSHPQEIEDAEEELSLHAADLITDELQDDRQRWKNAAAEIIATADIRIAALAAQLAAANARIPEWISVDERLPESWKQVLIFDGVDVEITSWTGKHWSNWNALAKIWQPLPAPPASAAKEEGE